MTFHPPDKPAALELFEKPSHCGCGSETPDEIQQEGKAREQQGGGLKPLSKQQGRGKEARGWVGGTGAVVSEGWENVVWQLT